jgi:hypothetical protein
MDRLNETKSRITITNKKSSFGVGQLACNEWIMWCQGSIEKCHDSTSSIRVVKKITCMMKTSYVQILDDGNDDQKLDEFGQNEKYNGFPQLCISRLKWEDKETRISQEKLKVYMVGKGVSWLI